MSLIKFENLRMLLGLALPLALTSCASMPAPPDVAPAHPANPRAALSPVPMLQPGLLAITNLVTSQPAAEVAPDHEHDHSEHGAKPTVEGHK